MNYRVRVFRLKKGNGKLTGISELCIPDGTKNKICKEFNDLVKEYNHLKIHYQTNNIKFDIDHPSEVANLVKVREGELEVKSSFSTSSPIPKGIGNCFAVHKFDGGILAFKINDLNTQLYAQIDCDKSVKKAKGCGLSIQYAECIYGNDLKFIENLSPLIFTRN